MLLCKYGLLRPLKALFSVLVFLNCINCAQLLNLMSRGAVFKLFLGLRHCCKILSIEWCVWWYFRALRKHLTQAEMRRAARKPHVAVRVKLPASLRPLPGSILPSSTNEPIVLEDWAACHHTYCCCFFCYSPFLGYVYFLKPYSVQTVNPNAFANPLAHVTPIGIVFLAFKSFYYCHFKFLHNNFNTCIKNCAHVEIVKAHFFLQVFFV